MTAVVLPVEVTAARDVVEPALRRAVGELAPAMRTISRYHFGWADASGKDTPGGGGKALRPALTLLSAQAAGGDPALALPAAVAVELVHNFSLLHDDVMDNDVERRHQPTAWTVFGVPAAILAGDALLTLAIEIARRDSRADVASAVIACLNESVQGLIVGQSSDVDFERRTDVTLQECLTMASGKTGALMRCSSSIGALAVGADESVVAKLAEFGDHLGLAFQLVDDLLGIWGSPAVTGKPALADLRSRKKSVPVVAALDSGTEAGARLAELYFAPDQPDQVDDEAALIAMADLVERAGAREWTETEADRHIRQAERCLVELGAPRPVTEALRATALFVTRRDR
ncbi:MAG TPA: polyprenyl synthetase family protein [Pseudonocardiaceae bacterium]|jgi:geranylgeranyl diphosphate synthase type I|nr:polyprenyl synthetase family protein [Pseudonocardiaceae bacterium]